MGKNYGDTMSTATVSSCCTPDLKHHNPTVGSCCPPPQKPLKATLYNQVLDIALKVSVAALGVIAAIASFQSFMITFSIGIVLGIYQGWSHKAQSRILSSGNFCTQGFIEQATGVKLPPEFNLAINVALTADHLVGAHPSQIHSMLLGVYVGTWLGNEIAPAMYNAFGKISHLANNLFHQSRNLHCGAKIS